MINGQIPPYDSSVIHQQPFQRDPDSRAYIGTNVSPQPQNPSNLPQHNSKEVISDIVLNLPVYKSSIKTDWFTRGNDNNWYYVRTDANGISQRKILFQVDIIQVTTIGQDNYGRFEHLVICYVNAGSSLLYTVIPFKKFMKKKLQDFFFLPAGFSIPNAKDNVINEFLFYLIMNCKNQRSVSSYPFQGWHIGINEQLEFECTNRYEDVFKSYLPSSILKRSNTIPYPYGELYLDKISSVLPNEWEVKFIIALRISSLILKFTYMNQVNPKQLFIFESTENCNTTLLSALLKTNNEYDTELFSLTTPQDRLISCISEVSDGIALIYDFSSAINSKSSSMSLSYLSDHLLKNSHSITSSKQLIAIISQFGQYDIEPEKYYLFSFDKYNLSYKYNEVMTLLTEIDYAVISYFNGRNANDVISEYSNCLSQQKSIIPTSLPIEVKDTYIMINCAMTIFNHILLYKSQYNQNTPYQPFFITDDIERINKFLLCIDRSGQNKIQRIIENFVNELNRAIAYFFKCIPVSQYIIDDVTDEVIFTDDENIYVSPTSVDSVIIPNMDIHIAHRQLVNTLVDNGIITGEYHNCCRIQYIDVFLQGHQIYRYRISRSILSYESQAAINKAANSEFFHDLSKIKPSGFIPFITDENTKTWAGRLIESGSKNNNHMLITGESGSGKSYLMIRMAAHLAELGERVIILDSSDSNTYSELCDALSTEFVEKNIDIYDIDKNPFPIDPFLLEGMKRRDSKANHIFNILRSAIYDASQAQSAKLKTLIYENIDSLEIEGSVSPDNLKSILVKDGSTISALRDKLLPLLVTLNDNTNYEKTWAEYLESPKNILVFSLNTTFEKQGKKLFDILLASLYLYHLKHKYSNLWLCIDEICDQNLSEDGVINKIFTQGRKSRINIIGATQKFELSRSDEWTTLNNAKTKVFFRPTSTSISDVMKELNMPQSQRSVFANMKQQECIISSELYSSKTKNNQPAVVSGKVPNQYLPLQELFTKNSFSDTTEDKG